MNIQPSCHGRKGQVPLTGLSGEGVPVLAPMELEFELSGGRPPAGIPRGFTLTASLKGRAMDLLLHLETRKGTLEIFLF